LRDNLDARVRSLRAPKPEIDPWQPIGTLFEAEPTAWGQTEETLTIFLAGAECPFTCVFCDLWRYTLGGPTPAGAIPRQIETALSEIPDGLEPRNLRIKLYNASNFFDDRAVPPVDDAAIADLLSPYGAVTVEAHPRLVGPRCFEFAERLGPALEVAMGLETVDPGVIERLNKNSSVAEFDRAAADLTSNGVDLRAFVLLAPPYQLAEEAVDWTVRSVRHALDAGARIVAINPVRSGNGFLDALRSTGEWLAPSLAQMEEALARSLGLDGGTVVIDLWEIDSFRGCSECDEERIANLVSMNADGVALPTTSCRACVTAPESHPVMR
jgi:archaeosine synthase beta-subunit